MKYWAVLLLFFSVGAHAGYFELGVSGNYRKLNLPTQSQEPSYDTTTSFTGSFAYYFAEMAAMELNYTKGQSERFVPGITADSRTTYDFSLVGLDLIFTFAKRKEPFIPYVKLGAAYFAEKDVTYEYTIHSDGSTRSESVELDPTFVPSAGFGLKIRLTRTMALKFGLEAWTSDSLDKDPRWDVAARAGISWFL
jgi:hypothetical protein